MEQGMGGSPLDFYVQGERREYRVRERELWLLTQAARALLELDASRQVRLGPMDPHVRMHLVRAVEKVEAAVRWRETYG